MREGKYQYGWMGTICIIKPIGSIQFKASPALDSFVHKVIQEEKLSGFIIDLSETEYIDSTNLGILANIYLHSCNNLHCRPTMIVTTDVIKDIVESLGFTRLFDIIDSPVHTQSELEEISHNHDDMSKDLQAVILSAHEYLASLNEENARKFKNVIDFARMDKSDLSE